MNNPYGHLGMAVVLCLFCAGIQAQDESEAADAHAFILRPVETGFFVSPEGVGRGDEVAFKQEPAYAGDKVYRRALRFGSEPADFIGVAYDVAADKLYIDRNRNLDLTDDGPAIAADDRHGSRSGVFSEVVIELIHGGIPIQYTLDINFYGDYFYPVVRSGWSGEIELAGRTCEMGIADNLDGLFDRKNTFVFEHDGHREARRDYGRKDELPLPKWLHFEGQSYLIESALRVLDDATVLAVSLIPITDDVMEIAFKGQHVSRVLLRDHDDKDYGYGLLDWPASAMRIPKGVYTPYRVDLLDSFYGWPRGVARLEPDGILTLQTGGPVRQEVSVRRAGAYLNLDYALRGVDKTSYRPDLAYQNSARFAVYRGDRKVGGAQFEYG